MNKALPELSQERASVIGKIKQYEKLGGDYFFCDVENDPPSKTLMPSDVDYLYKKIGSKAKATVARLIEFLGARSIIKAHDIELLGKENVSGITGGAIITSNHFNKFENLGPKLVCKAMPGRHRFWRVIREGNYFIPGFLGFLLKYCNTLPISSNHRTMVNLGRAIETVLSHGDCVLVYPEQSMWYNYKKPRKYRIGAYYYAAKNNVPVIPCFTTLSELGGYDSDGYPNIKYTVHIMPPIYPDPELSYNENAEKMLAKNFELCKNKYEEVYKIPLTYGEDEEQ